MGDTNFFETMLNRLHYAERFYDGPIPPPLRRQILAPPAADDAGGGDTWRRLARESALRLRRLKPAIGFAASPEARLAATRAYRREMHWFRDCMERWRETRRRVPAGWRPRLDLNQQPPA